MTTTMILVRHAATPANLQTPALLQGRHSDPGLAPFGKDQAEATRRALVGWSIQAAYTSPLRRASETAAILLAGRDVTAKSIEALTECDVGRWEGHSWEAIRLAEPEAYAAYHADPGRVPYAGGESFGDVAARVTPTLQKLLDRHSGQTILVVSHHVVNRVYLAGLLGLPPSQARRISLENGSISLVQQMHGKARLQTLNAALHLPHAA